jgi:ABC-2 type transport system ATP-binding protein
MTAAIRTENLTRHYRRSRKAIAKSGETGPLVALEGVSLEVRPGELFGLLGPNGAGKTTLIRILTTLLAPTSGAAWVDGMDVSTQAKQIRPIINMVSGGEHSGYGVLNVVENLWLFARIYGVPTALARERITKMLEIVGLSDKARTRLSHLSTGQRQKMNFCRGFITDPKILFLDEPTLGLDVNAARSIRKFLREWLAERQGRTLLLTTHYMAEADELCDRLAVIDHGRVLACDTPANLKRRVQRYPIYELSLTPGGQPEFNPERLPGVRSVHRHTTADSLEYRLVLEEEEVIGTVVPAALVNGSRIRNLKKTEPSLEDVFIQMVGHGLENGTEEA